MIGGNGRGKNAQLFVIASAGDDFFAPIAVEISAQDRIRFGAVIGDAIKVRSREQTALGGILVVPFSDGHAIKQFAEQVAIPPDSHVAGARGGVRNFFAARIEQAGNACACDPAFVAGMTWINVEGSAATGSLAI